MCLFPQLLRATISSSATSPTLLPCTPCDNLPSYAGGASPPGRFRALGSSFLLFCLSLSPCLFLPVFFLSFTGLRTGGVSGAMGTSDSSFPIRHPFCPCRWIDGGRWRGARARIAHFLFPHSFTWIGAGVGQEGRVDFLLTVPYPAPSTLLEVVVSPLPSPLRHGPRWWRLR